MKKKTISALLVLLLLLAQIPVTALALEPARHTEFFNDQSHTELSFDQMVIRPVDMDAMTQTMDIIRSLMGDASNSPAIDEPLAHLKQMYLTLYDNATLAYIRSAQDGGDEEAAQLYQECYAELLSADDLIQGFLIELLASPCASAAERTLSQNDLANLKHYTPLTEELKELLARETALTSQYWAAYATPTVITVDGTQWDSRSADGAYAAKELGYNDLMAILEAINQEDQNTVGPIFLELVQIRNRIAQLRGYDSYADYAYEQTFLRDYSPRDIRSFHAAVKSYIVPVYHKVNALYQAQRDLPLLTTDDFSGDISLDLMEPILAQLSDELLESFTYMRDRGLYDTAVDQRKTRQGFTALIAGYNAPFFFNYPEMGLWDFTTTAHEFGHYNNFYWSETGWSLGDFSYDVAEVHSQTMELLMLQYYPELIEGEDSAEMGKIYVLRSLLRAIITGCLEDEFQQIIYSHPEMTLTEINDTYCRLNHEYGILPPSYTDTEYRDWITIPHTFESPFYYISYAVSAAGAFSFWLESQDDYLGAVDRYLEFAALDHSCGFREGFEAIGVESPLSASYLSALGEAIRTYVQADQRFTEIPSQEYYMDVPAERWYADAVDYVHSNGLMDPVVRGGFLPDQPMTRALLVEALYRACGSPAVTTDGSQYSDVGPNHINASAIAWAAENGIVSGYGNGCFGPDASLTRQQMAVILRQYTRYLGGDGTVQCDDCLDRFADRGESSPYARTALQWSVETGVLSGVSSHRLAPRGTVSRAQAAQVLMNLSADPAAK